MSKTKAQLQDEIDELKSQIEDMEGYAKEAEETHKELEEFKNLANSYRLTKERADLGIPNAKEELITILETFQEMGE